jgi:hypothetical protein
LKKLGRAAGLGGAYFSFFLLPYFIVAGKFPRQRMKKEKGRVKNVAAAVPN